jgi:hypothetical protein
MFPTRSGRTSESASSIGSTNDMASVEPGASLGDQIVQMLQVDFWCLAPSSGKAAALVRASKLGKNTKTGIVKPDFLYRQNSYRHLS